jgi:hypothetical protein
MKTLYGNKLVINPDTGITLDKIPVGNWIVDFNPQNGYSLIKSTPFKIPSKLYGNPEKEVDRFIKAYQTFDKNLGISLVGLKGSGKSITAQLICIKSELPVIMIGESYGDVENLVDYIQSIEESFVLFIDEYDKKFSDWRDQNKLLSLMDGVNSGNDKKIFIFTSNDSRNMNEYMKNRLGRIRYYVDYTRMSDEILNEVIDDLLEDTSKKQDILNICKYVGDINMDSLIGLIKECNLFTDYTPYELIKVLNLQPEDRNYNMVVYDKKTSEEIDSGITNWNNISVIRFDNEEGEYCSYNRDQYDIEYDNDITILNTKDGKFTINLTSIVNDKLKYLV